MIANLQSLSSWKAYEFLLWVHRTGLRLQMCLLKLLIDSQAGLTILLQTQVETGLWHEDCTVFIYFHLPGDLLKSGIVVFVLLVFKRTSDPHLKI